MATLGSTAKPTTTQEFFGLNSTNQIMMALTLPAGGPWRIYRLGIWVAGVGSSASGRLALWTAGGTYVRSSSLQTFAGAAFGLGNTFNYESNITDYIVAGGTTVYVGFWRDPADSVQNGRTGSGTHIHDTHAGSNPGDLGAWSSDSGGTGAYLFYDAANSLPTAPSGVAPVTGAIVSPTPFLDWVHNDPDGDPQSAYQLQISTVSNFATTVFDSGTVVTSTTSYTVASALTRGTTYYWRVRTKDAVGFGPWGSAASFKVASLPTATVTAPGTDTTAPLYYDGGSDTTPKMNPSWTFSCPDGGTQTGASVKIYDAAGTTLLATYAHTGSATTARTTYAVANGTKYRVTVTPTCSHGVTGNESAQKRCQVRWGRASYRADLGAAPLTLSATVTSTLNGGQVVVEYGSTSGTTPEPTDWKLTVAEVTKQRYVWHRVTLMPAVAASPTSPNVSSVVWSYSASVLAPDYWNLLSYGEIDVGTFVYGTQSLKMTEDVLNLSRWVSQYVDVMPNTDYILSGRIKSDGRTNARIALFDPFTNGFLVGSPIISAAADWARYNTPVWNSGGADQVLVACEVAGDVGAHAWFDALKLEASTVVTPWTPGFLGNAVTIDAGGLNVDGAAGGILRLRGSVGGTRDVVSIGANGLKFAGDTELSSPSTGVLAINGNSMSAWRYVPMTPFSLLSASTSANIAVTALTLTGVPTNAVAVQVKIRCSTSVPDPGDVFHVFSGLNSGHHYLSAYAGSVAAYVGWNGGMVPCDSTPRIYYRVDRVAGSVSYFLDVVGYWVAT